MISGVVGSNFSGVQALRALNAFKTDEKIVQNFQKQIEDNVQVQPTQKDDLGVSLKSDISVEKTDEIKKYGEMFDMNISNSDINYALAYGRSVIVDYSA